MRTSILMSAAAAAFLAFAPASFAQDEPPPGGPPPAAAAPDAGNWTLKQREDWLSSRIDKAHDDGDIDGHEADRVHHELDRIKDDENRMRDHHDGQLTDDETTELEARLDQMASQIHWLHEHAFQRPW